MLFNSNNKNIPLINERCSCRSPVVTSYMSNCNSGETCDHVCLMTRDERRAATALPLGNQG